MSRHRNRLPPTRLRRSGPKIRARIALTIFCEGGRTEPEYLVQLWRDYANPLVEVIVEGAQGVPATLVDKAVMLRRQRSRRRRDSFEAEDQIWVVFDRDDHEVAAAMDKARANGIGIAYSNPCVELWGVLHFVEHNAPMNREAIGRLLETYMPRYDRTGAKCFDYTCMRGRCEVAEQRAERLQARRIEEGDPEGNPFTSMHELTRLIRAKGTR